MNAILAMAFKDIKLTLRDPMGLFWIVAFPLLMAVLIGAVFSGSGGGGSSGALRVMVVNEADNDLSARFIGELQSNEALTITRWRAHDDGTTVPLTLDFAMDSLRRGSTTGAILLTGDFETNMGALFGGQGDIGLQLAVDPSRRAEKGFLEGMVMQAYFSAIQRDFTNPGLMREQLQRGIADFDANASGLDPGQRLVYRSFLTSLDLFLANVEPETLSEGMGGGEGGGGMRLSIPTIEVERESRPVPTSYEISFPQATTWGLLACVTAFALTLVRERTSGALVRLQASPITPWQVLAGKGAACFLACLLVIAELFVIAALFFDVTVESLGLFTGGAICASLCFTGIMMLVSTIGKTEAAVGGAGWAVMMPLAMAGGAMVPLMAMPGWMLAVSNFSPVKWAIYSFEGAVWRELTLAEALPGWGILVATGAVAFGLGVSLLVRSRSV